ARAATVDYEAFDGLGKQCSPVVGLLRPHGPSVDAGDALNPEGFPEQPVLRLNIIKGCYECGIVRRIGWTRREPIAEHIRNDNKPAGRIEHTIWADQPFDVMMLGSETRGI